VSRVGLLFIIGGLGACFGPREYSEPMGLLPTAVTTAEPLWLPFSFQAGKRAEIDPREARLSELRQLTFDGRSGRPAWQPDARGIVFERRDEAGCARIVAMDLGSGDTRELSETGCAATPVFRAGELLFAASAEAPRCVAPWLSQPVEGCELSAANGNLVASAPGFDGEPFALGGVIVFTSTRDGDPELYRLDDGEPVRLTDAPGYDGGATLSPDGEKLAWHARRGGARRGGARLGEEGETSEAPGGGLALMIAGSRGQHPRVVTARGRLNADPAFLTDSRRLIFSSDFDAAAEGGPLDLYLVDPEGAATAACGVQEGAGGCPPIERITFSPGYDGEARVSPDGRHILFTSSRGGDLSRRDVFVARWREPG
jgi:TolB protein